MFWPRSRTSHVRLRSGILTMGTGPLSPSLGMNNSRSVWGRNGGAAVGSGGGGSVPCAVGIWMAVGGGSVGVLTGVNVGGRVGRSTPPSTISAGVAETSACGAGSPPPPVSARTMAISARTTTAIAASIISCDRRSGSARAMPSRLRRRSSPASMAARPPALMPATGESAWPVAGRSAASGAMRTTAVSQMEALPPTEVAQPTFCRIAPAITPSLTRAMMVSVAASLKFRTLVTATTVLPSRSMVPLLMATLSTCILISSVSVRMTPASGSVPGLRTVSVQVTSPPGAANGCRTSLFTCGSATPGTGVPMR